jgi:hypothetical protein
VKDFTEEELQPIGKIPGEAIDLINFCLEQLYKEKDKMTSDEVCKHLTYEDKIIYRIGE